MRSTKAFLLGIGTAVLVDRVRARRRTTEATAADDTTIEHRVFGEALPAAGVAPDEIEVEVEDGVVTL